MPEYKNRIIGKNKGIIYQGQEKDNNIKNLRKKQAFKLVYKVNVTALTPRPQPVTSY